MKLKSWKKKNEHQKLTISLGIVICIFMIGIVIYKTFSLYEEARQFNVIIGNIPDQNYDVKLAVTLDGETQNAIPNRGLYKTNIECTGNTTGEWDYNAWTLNLTNAENRSKCKVNFTSNLPQEEYDKYIEAGIALRRNTYRGKDITSYWQDKSLYEMISNCTFDDIYVGDYIRGNKSTWLVADINNYQNITTDNSESEQTLNQCHVTIIPEKALEKAAMNTEATTEGGYVGSNMYKEILPRVLNNYILPDFENHVLKYPNLLTHAVDLERNDNSAKIGQSIWWWYERQVDLMSEMNVWGSKILSWSGADIGIDNQQYAIFRLNPKQIYSNLSDSCAAYWLKGVADQDSFTVVSYQADVVTANVEHGVRPRFLIG